MIMRKLLLSAVLAICILLPSAGEVLTVASYNIRYSNEKDAANGNGWQQRCPVICRQIMFHDFDLIGAQEVLKPQLDDMLSTLTGYGYVGVGRDDGCEAGEYAPIFYKEDRFQLLESGYFWLSESPSEPARGWDAKYPRICTWARFRDRKTRKKFLFFNTHFDHIGVEARNRSAELIISRIRELSGRDRENAVLTGDFNVDQYSPSYAALTESGYLRDSFETARIRMAENGTTNGFSVNRKTDRRIDHILVTDGVEVIRYGVLTELYWSETEDSDVVVDAGNFPEGHPAYHYIARNHSDHYPICVQMAIK